MKKRWILIAAAAAVLLLPTLSFGDAYPFESTLTDSDGVQTDTIWQRYFTAGSDKISPGGAFSCSGTWDPATNACSMVYKKGTKKNPKRAWRGYADDIGSFTGICGEIYHGVHDMQSDAGTSNHRAYYAWACQPVNCNETYEWKSVDCSGVLSTGRCIGPLNPSTAVGYELTNVPQSIDGPNTIAPIEMMRPVPIPTVQSYDKTTGDITLSWRAADAVGCGASAQYLLHYAARAAGQGLPAPTEADFSPDPLGRVFTGTSATVNVADFGFNPGDEQILTFALQLRYGDAAGTPVDSLYISGNSQDVYIGAGGLGSDITDIVVKPIGRSAVEITWRTSLEENLRGFFVGRSLSASGPFEKVSDLIPANGEPSSYSFIDRLAGARGARVTPGAEGLFYTVISVNNDGTEEQSEPVQLQLPSVPNDRPLRMRPRR